ncbi:hypothetical protein D9615_002136 [Tricholomella constricta]|uniref:Uncharacterized protein n=1 Tax=Tricholomella constricta TaxID=117010 RepID=A0A8H5MAT3_9AGAR|nr:hypothetical protein D9615_002136 [Tricholomella constricta]
MVISSIMINRITLNLKRASERKAVVTWSIKTFEPIHIGNNSDHLVAGDIPLEPIFRRGTGNPETAFAGKEGHYARLPSQLSQPVSNRPELLDNQSP